MTDALIDADAQEARTADHPVLPLILGRWSPRAFAATPVPQSDLDACLEAARWAPSAYNDQPWHFVYGTTEAEKAPFIDAMVDFNQSWAKTAPVLLALCARKNLERDGTPNRHFTFDCGAAWALLAIEARQRGYYTHAMAGYDPDKAAANLGVPDSHEIITIIALGRRGDKAILPDYMQAMEQPSTRKPVPEIASRGRFGA